MDLRHIVHGMDDDDAMSVASTPPSPSLTERDMSVDGSVRAGSPSSVWSMSSSLQEAAYRTEFGRVLNNYSEIYNFPADEEELGRLDKQHELLIEATGGKYPPPMPEVMAQSYEGEVKACLDLGCGSASWMVDVANDFPHSEVVGVDLVPVQLSRDLPPNCRQEVDDINLGLQHFYGAFDVVHVRFLSSGIRDYKNLVDEISHILRPGGLVDLSETDFHAYDQNFRRLHFEVTELRPPWYARFLVLVGEATKALGGDPDAATHLYDWVKEHPAFEEVSYREYWIPSSPWMERLGIARGPMITAIEDNLAYLDTARPVLLRRGHPENLVDTMIARSREELTSANQPYYARLFCVHARKKKTRPAED